MYGFVAKKENIVHFCYRKWVIAVNKNEKLRHVFQQIVSFLFWCNKIKESFFCKIFFLVFPYMPVYHVLFKLKQTFELFKSYSYDKMPIDWVSQARWENIWVSFMAHRPHCALSVHYVLESNISCPALSLSLQIHNVQRIVTRFKVRGFWFNTKKCCVNI